MSVLRRVFAVAADTMTPDGTVLRLRLRISLDTLVALAVALLAVGLAVGYQVLGCLGRRAALSD